MHINEIDVYEIQIVSGKCIVILSCGRYYRDFFISFINPSNPYLKQITLGEVLEKKNLYGKPLVEGEQLKNINQMSNDQEKDILAFSIIIEKYCQDLLSGDFSIMEST